MYRVGDKEFASFPAAVDYAKQTNQEVFHSKSGGRRWCPPSKAPAKRMRRYFEQKAAHEAQSKGK